MGVFWTVWPLDGVTKPWLNDIGVNYPDIPSRFPTGLEIKEVVKSLHDYDVEINDNGLDAMWQASIVHKDGGDTGRYTMLNINKYSGDNDEQELWFEKGWPELIEDILKELSKACGPLVLIPDTGDTPTVIKN